MRLSWLLLIITSTAGEEAPRVLEMKAPVGVQFSPRDTIIFSATTWSLAFSIDLSSMAQDLERLQAMVTNTHPPHTPDHLKKGVDVIKRNLEVVAKELKYLQDYVSGTMSGDPTEDPNWVHRGKRNIVGGFIGSLFGLATQDEVQELHGHLEQLYRRTGKIVSIQKQHLTVFKELENRIQEQQRQISSVIDLTVTLFDTLTESGQHPGTITALIHNDILTAINTLHGTIIDTRRMADQLRLGYLDPSLLSPARLQEALVHIQQKMPKDLQLVLNTENGNLHEYYRWPLAKIMFQQNRLQGILTIPLAPAGQRFNLFLAQPFPAEHPEEKGSRFQLDISPTYIAVTGDKQHYTLLGEDFSENSCIGSNPRICPGAPVVATNPQQHCLFQIIAGRVLETAACKYRVVPDDRLAIMAITRERWAISATKPTRIYIQCLVEQQNMLMMKTQSEITVEGQQELILPNHCAATIEDLVIPLRAKMHSDQGSSVPALKISLEDVKQMMKSQTDHLQQSVVENNFFKAYQQALKTQANIHNSTGVNNKMDAMLQMINYELNQPDGPGLDRPSYFDITFFIAWSISTICLVGCVLQLRRNRTPYRIDASGNNFNLTG